MSDHPIKFSKKFMFGAASAAYQVEGAWNEDNRKQIIWDKWTQAGHSYGKATGDVASDFYHQYKNDIALMKEQGLETFRFSIAWSRIIPTGNGEVNQKGIEFYHNVIDELLKNEIEPIVTLHHFDNPLELEEIYPNKNWANRQFIDDFLKYAKICFEAYRSKVKTWIIINEPNIFSSTYFRSNTFQKLLNIEQEQRKNYNNGMHILALVHAKTINLFKKMKMKGIIGSSVASLYAISLSTKEEDEKALNYYNAVDFYHSVNLFTGIGYDEKTLEIFKDENIMPTIEEGDLEILKEEPSLLGWNYYQTLTVAAYGSGLKKSNKVNTSGKKGTNGEIGIKDKYKIVINPNFQYNDWDWAIYPQGFTDVLLLLANKYNLPILISENGLGAKDELTEDFHVHDDYRIQYLKQHLKALAKAIEEGANIIGYCNWSFVDLFSWTNGYQKRYGFVYLNRDETDLKDMKRYKKDSFYWYKWLIEKREL